VPERRNPGEGIVGQKAAAASFRRYCSRKSRGAGKGPIVSEDKGALSTMKKEKEKNLSKSIQNGWGRKESPSGAEGKNCAEGRGGKQTRQEGRRFKPGVRALGELVGLRGSRGGSPKKP